MSGDVYIVGIDMIKFGKFPERSVESLGAEAALGALDDAGLTIRDMEALYCGNLMYASGMVGQRILREIGLTGIPVVNCANACATGATAFREGWIAIKAGLYDLVLAVGVEKMAGAGLLGGPRESGIPTEGLLGSGTMPCVFAEAGLEHSRKYGTTFEQFAKVAVKNHHHATMNPKARYQMETPLEEVMSAEMISYPNTKLMCSANVDGSAAAVIASEKMARKLGSEARGQGDRVDHDLGPLHAARPGDARRLDLHPRRGEAGLRDGRRRPRGPRPDRAPRLLRHRRDPALREPRPVRRRRGGPHDRQRRHRARRQDPGQPLGRPALQGPSAGSDRHRQPLRDHACTCAARPASGRPRTPRSVSRT